ncbi:hypothetical protein H5410_051665 [Solanum commersonii]|uniref:Uncharacterized protein n=1 Tax=Solanum commersonii TaxID=4109 RepID=A0A9J5X1E0_SOLCO|nr:hypothetical protein H5410_051665 [Solanum commersonii]
MLYLKMHTKLKIQLVFIVVEKCAVKDHSVLLVRVTNALDDPPFGLLHRLLALAFNIFTFWIIGRYSTISGKCLTTRPLLLFIVTAFGDSPNVLGDPQALFSSSFQPKTEVRQFKKDVSNGATLDSIMNAHTRLNLLICDTPLSKNLKLTILTSNANSSSTKESNAPYKRMIPYSHSMIQKFKVPESNATLTLTKKNTMPAFTHRFTHIFQ